MRAAAERGGLHRGYQDVWVCVPAERPADGTEPEGSREAVYHVHRWCVPLSNLFCFVGLPLTLLGFCAVVCFFAACYESKTKLFVTSEVPIHQVFSGDTETKGSGAISDHMRSVMDDLVRSVLYIPSPPSEPITDRWGKYYFLSE